jgi:SAM-dependent methyltransferase
MDWHRFWNEDPQVFDPDSRRQVGRTFRGVGYSDQAIDALVARLVECLHASPDSSLLDLACGNGLLTHRLASHVRTITAVDYSAPLIATARQRFARANIEYVVGDAVELSHITATYDGAVLSAALQHFDRTALSRLLRRLRDIVTPGGRVVLADVADRDRIWRFYRGLSGRLRYGRELLSGRPTIGYWWSPARLCQVAGSAGWAVSVLPQPGSWPNHYFRYDAVLERAEPSARDAVSRAARRASSSGKPGTINS